MEKLSILIRIVSIVNVFKFNVYGETFWLRDYCRPTSSIWHSAYFAVQLEVKKCCPIHLALYILTCLLIHTLNTESNYQPFDSVK